MLLTEYLNSQFSLAQNLDFILRITVSCLCGACIGFERSKRYKEAGIRTHIIVCFAAALMMIVSKYYFFIHIISPYQFLLSFLQSSFCLLSFTILSNHSTIFGS